MSQIPFPVGNIYTASLYDIYYSERARAYRRGSAACDRCSLRAVCGGCPAVIHGHGLDPSAVKDPACFFAE